MKVTQNNSPIQMDAYLKQIKQQRQNQKDVQSAGSAAKGAIDKVELSSQAKAIQKTAFSLGQTEEGRAEKVRQVKMDIDNGTYTVNPAQVATDMLREAFENQKVLQSIDIQA